MLAAKLLVDNKIATCLFSICKVSDRKTLSNENFAFLETFANDYLMFLFELLIVFIQAAE